MADGGTDAEAEVEALSAALAGRRRARLLLRQRLAGLAPRLPARAWPRLLLRAHRALLRDLSKTSGDLDDSYPPLLKDVVSEANSQRRYIDCETILECAKEILECEKFARVVGDTYIYVLDEYVLGVRFYLEKMTPSQWTDLFGVVAGRCDDRAADYFGATRLLAKILKEGPSRCHLILPIRDGLSSVENLYASSARHDRDNLRENLIKIAIATAKNLAAECRLTVCRFTETVVPCVLKFYERTVVGAKADKKLLLFKFLKLSILVHHPKGKFDINSGCLADNVDSWNDSLRLIHQLVTAESSLVTEYHKKKNSSLSMESETDAEFIELAVELSHQIFKGTVINLCDESLQSTSKRLRCDSYDFSSLRQVLYCLPDYFYPWIIIVKKYIFKYGSYLTEDEICSILNALYKLSMSDIIDNDQRALYEAIVCIFEVIIQQNWSKQYEEVTLKLWNVAFRKASIQSIISNTCHRTLNVLLRLKKKNPPVESLITLYCDQTMPYSYESLVNLNILLSYHNSKMNDENMRMQITKWVLSNYLSIKCNELIAILLFQLCLKENIPHWMSKQEVVNDNIFYNIFDDSESFMLISDFEMDLLVEKRIDAVSIVTAPSIFTIWDCIYNNILRTLTENISNKIIQFRETGVLTQNMLIDIHTTLKFISLFVNQNIISFDKFKDTTVIITGAMDALNAYISSYFSNTSERSDDKIEFLFNLKALYDENYHCDIKSFIRDKTYKEIFETLCMIVSSGSDQIDGDLFQSEMTETSNLNNQLKKSTLEVILHYTSSKSRYTDKLQNFILNAELYDFNNEKDLFIAMDVIIFITEKFDKNSVPISAVVKFMQEMCVTVYRNNNATYKLLSVLNNILYIIGPNESSTAKENCLIMLQGFLKKCSSHYYSTKTMGLALKCLCCALINCNIQNHNGITHKTLFKGLCSNIHSIRIYSCYCISLYISKVSPENFRELYSLLDDIFTLNAADLSNSIKKDEGANRTSTVLHCLASIAISSSACDKKSLFAITKLAYDKNISVLLLRKVFILMAKFIGIPLNTMISNNISFLLSSWYKAKLPINNFPWSLGKHQTFENFVDAYKHIIIPLEFYWTRQDEKKMVVDIIVQNNDGLLNKLILEYLPNLLVLYISSVNSEDLIGNVLSLKIKLEQKYNQQMPAEEILYTKIKSDVDIILYEIMLLVYDHVMFEDIEWSGYLPYVVMPVLSVEKFELVIHYLNELYQENFISDLCRNYPEKIKNIFFKLWSDIESHYTLEGKLLSLRQYSLFCNTLPIDTKLNAYIYYFIINALLSLIKTYSDHKRFFLLSVLACKILHGIFKKIIPKLSQLVTNLLSSIVTTLSKFALKLKNCNNALDILKFLLIDMKEYFKETIKILDPLPDLDIFKKINQEIQKDSTVVYCPLKEQIDNFIRGDISDRYEGLNLLFQTLISNRIELVEMFNNLKNVRGFSEDCKSSSLHHLSYTLIKIMSNFNDENSCLQACRCLGELGPSNLQTLILRLSSDYDKIDKPLEYFIFTLLNEIKNLIFNEDPLVMNAVSDGLISIFTYIEGVAVLESLNNKCPMIKDLMLPFLPKKKKYLSTNLKLSAPMFDTYLDCPELWYDFESKKHSEWIVDIVESALKCVSDEQCFLYNLTNICRLRASVSEKCFPSLIGLILSIANENQITTISTHVKLFFKYYFDKTYTLQTKNNTNSQIIENDNIFIKEFNRYFDKESVDCMLQLVQFIRLHMKSYELLKNEQYFMQSTILELDYLSIAWAAYLNGSYFMSIFYCELWCTINMNGIPSNNPELIINIPKGEDMLKIMRLCYQSIGDDDALSGCGFSHYSSPVERRNHFIFKRSYIDALLMHDTSLSNQNSSTSTKDFASSLFKSGLYHLTNRYIQSFETDNLFDDIKYECYWRLGNWDLNVDSFFHESKSISCEDSISLTKSNCLWSVHQYNCLKKTLMLDPDTSSMSLGHLKEARKYIAQKYSSNAVENCQSGYYLGEKCQILQEIEKFSNLILNKNCPDKYKNLIDCWSVDNILPFANFKNLEPILSQRIILLDYIKEKSSNIDIRASIAILQLKYAELAAFHGWSHVSNRWINNASQIVHNLSAISTNNDISGSYMEKLKCLVTLAEGTAAWNSGHQDLAIHLIKSIILKGEIVGNESYAKALMTYGTWMVETRQESPPDILNSYLQLSLDVLESNVNHSNKIDTYLVIARFCDGEYKQMDTYMKSANFVNQVNRMKRCNENYTSLKEKSTQSTVLSKDQRKAMIFNDRQLRLDAVEINNIQVERKQYLHKAIKYYLLTLQNGEKYNHCVFRMISLWLNNPSCELNQFTDRSSIPIFPTIPSRKFLPLLPQLGPRLGSTTYNESFQNHLRNLIKTCTIEHPHHTLPILLALKNSQMDLTENVKDNGDKGYAEIAKKILGTIASVGENLPNIIKQMDALCSAMIQLANLKTEPKNGKIRIPRSHSLQCLKKLDHVLIPTVNLPVSHELDYKNIPSIFLFSDDFTLVGGMNAPKKLSCRGSNGLDYNMLLKCDDDIRQDAVMQQVFGVVNNLLNENHQTKQRRLLIRTYKITVLSNRSGILQWCDGSESYGCILTGADGKKGYYSKFRPNDLPARSAREQLASKIKASNDEKLKVFKSILSKFKPVFHLFFIENWQCPAIWYERKLAYTQSVATSSMAGYILGIGDRHVQNILIDKSTAEVIHIDFGIAFEQGKLQPTPETVPFRLTQNMVAGFGCTGVEGIFKRCCEKTMDVLKANKETLVTILEVLLCDPLYIWTISEGQNIQKPPVEENTESEGDISSSIGEAQRVLERVQSKLESAEFGRTLATSGQVARLIQQATDINNLSRLFHGWQPYL